VTRRVEHGDLAGPSRTDQFAGDAADPGVGLRCSLQPLDIFGRVVSGWFE
jgi:hypothetical protein